MNRSLLTLVAVLPAASLLAGCFPGSPSAPSDDAAGFFTGVWHGWIAPLSLILSVFRDDIRVYEVHNTGWWYDFGFYIAVISGFGGISLFRRRKKHDQ